LDWLLDNLQLSQEKILEFHQNENLGTKETLLKMKRLFVETVHITSVKKVNKKVTMLYENLVD
jgi:hypothetical protein